MKHVRIIEVASFAAHDDRTGLSVYVSIYHGLGRFEIPSGFYPFEQAVNTNRAAYIGSVGIRHDYPR